MRAAGFLAVTCLMASAAAAAGIEISAATPRGRLSCESPGRLEATGSVMRAGASAFALDLCLPTQECSQPIRAEFSVTAPGFAGFDRYLLPAAFVRVNLAIERRDGGCSQRITVSGVASWVGARNPAGRGDEFFLAAADGSTEALGNVPFYSTRCAGGSKTLGLGAGNARSTLRAGVSLRMDGLTGRLLTAGECNSARGWTYWVAGQPVR